MSSSAKTSKATKTATPAAAAPVVAAPAPVVEAATKAKGTKKAAVVVPAVAAPAPVVAAPVTDATVTAPVVEEDVATKLSKAVARSAEIAHQQKTLASEAGAIAKEIEKLSARLAKKAAGRRKRASPAEGSTSNNGKAFITPVPITNELAAFLGLEKGALISRRDVSKRLYAYAKSHNLQKGKVINTDATLRKLLGVTEKDEVTILNLQKHINKHYIKPTPVAA
jgi:hypothetical protein